MRARLSDQQGFTLIELLVSMAAGMVVLGAAFLVVEIAVKTQVDASARVESVQKGRHAVNDITRSLRAQTCMGDGTPAFIAASDSSVQLYTSVTSASADYQRIQRRTIAFVPDASGGTGKIVETTELGVGQPPDITSWGAAEQRILAQDVSLISGTPFLTYYAFEGNPASATLKLTSPVSAGDLYRIVRVEFAFQATSGRVSQVNPTLRFVNSASARTADPDAKEGTLACR